ncbi:PadR family transcriptional regulator PadR [Deinobacterium chartae]|uniref:PadR family transcriptional regulator PadR n=1 Tax=Deinobacterium chartae TaxID=521158 RepID=A0A841HUU4_9DEIO|nr:PadR family transcriptional regulator PadR [Deinobacterium chartae]
MTNDWLTQLRRGTVEYGVLALIGQFPRYGYDLVQSLGRWEPLAATEGTLYPLLRRLQKEGLIESYWQESETGPPRKYYRLTPTGQRQLNDMDRQWQDFASAVEALRLETFPETHHD